MSELLSGLAHHLAEWAGKRISKWINVYPVFLIQLKKNAV